MSKRKTKELPTQAKLEAIFDYCAETGSLTWRYRPSSPKFWNTRRAGTVAGAVMPAGYRLVGLNGNQFYAHRLIWKLVHNEEPVQIDHVNHKRDDNRIENLRSITCQDNQMNRSRSLRNNKSGIVGVSWNTMSSKWIAMIKVNSKQKYLGCYALKDDAAKARKRAEKQYGFHENHGS